VFEHTPPRLVLVDGIAVEAPLDGTMLVMCNNDRPGVIGDVGTVLGRHQLNIATFALGREGDRAIGVVIVDETAPIPDAVISELAKIPAVREVRLVRV
jgi:D-3-phosphoglycerate dehydrogenase